MSNFKDPIEIVFKLATTLAIFILAVGMFVNSIHIAGYESCKEEHLYSDYLKGQKNDE